MGTFHVEIENFQTDPRPVLSQITSQDPQAGAYAQAGYELAKQLWGHLNAPPRVAVSGGVLPLADGGYSVALTVSAYVAPTSDVSYRDQIMALMKQGPDASSLCTRAQPHGGRCSKPYAHTDACNPLGGTI